MILLLSTFTLEMLHPHSRPNCFTSIGAVQSSAPLTPYAHSTLLYLPASSCTHLLLLQTYHIPTRQPNVLSKPNQLIYRSLLRSPNTTPSFQKDSSACHTAFLLHLQYVFFRFTIVNAPHLLFFNFSHICSTKKSDL